MPRTLRFAVPLCPSGARSTPAGTLLTTLAAALLAALGACVATPIPIAAQPDPPFDAVLEGYVGRARLDAGVAGAPARLEAAGARLLVPVARFAPASTPRWLGERMAVGGYVTTVSAGYGGTAAQHFGVLADLRLTPAPLAGRIEPLVSLGVGSFRTRRDAPATALASPLCLRPAGPAVRAEARCVRLQLDAADAPTRALALGPAVGLRVQLVPGLALRADARDVIVYHGGPRHNPELALGLSFAR